MKYSSRIAAAFFIFEIAIGCPVSAQSMETAVLGSLRWRSIGPYRGGRMRALSGVPREPNVFYVAQVNGGVWKTDDFGRTWRPIFDKEPTGSVGTIAVAPSDPNVIYVGSGEGLQRPDPSTGDGIYKSTDAGKSWTHLGLRNGQQIPKIAVDPHDPNRLFVAVLGHPYGPNPERGLFRSTDGGQTFEKVLYKGDDTGANDVIIDPAHPDTVYTAFWEARQGPWENAAWSGTGGGVFKSVDGGNTWRQLGNGLSGVIQANLAISLSNPNRLYATAANAKGVSIYRTDDGGENWTRTTDDPRPAGRIGGGDCPVPAVDPKNPDIVYSASTVTWKSIDAGKTWTGIRGAPGGDDYQGIWINPNTPQVILLVSDQGAIVTVNGGETWSSWYNQPTAQFYHVIADNAWPYRVCGGQQESGSACISSRGADGAITFRDWHPAGLEEYGYAAPDPLDPDIVYGGKLTRYNRRTGQVQNVSPRPLRSGDFRVVRTAPVQFSPVDPHTLYFAANTLWKTRDGGTTWQQISPDLTRSTWTIPASVGKYRDAPTAQPTQRGVIYAIAPSPLDMNRIWAGTDDGLIQVTADGGAHWKDVTPPQLGPWMKVSILDAGHTDAATAYAAINTLRLDDLRPHILRTHDGGKTWTEIVNGLPNDAPVDVVREDPRRKGLLYAGTEHEVFVSFDDGDHWQSLRLNMPATSIRDLVVKDDDLLAGTHGRGFWILDNVTPLRQAGASLNAVHPLLFKPQTATRVRWDMNTDTPLPPDEPAGENPSDGAIIDYYLPPGSSGPVTLEILDSAGHNVRRYSSADPVQEIDPMLPVPKYWVRPPQVLAASPGAHRFLWDLHWTPIPQDRPEYPISAIPHGTDPAPTSPWVLPGTYTVKLSAAGQTFTAPLSVRMDPRVRTGLPGLTQQYTASKLVYDDALRASAALEQVRGFRKRLAERKTAAGTAELDGQAAMLEGNRNPLARRRGTAAPMDTLGGVYGQLGAMLQLLQSADVPPTASELKAVNQLHSSLVPLVSRWEALQAKGAGQ